MIIPTVSFTLAAYAQGVTGWPAACYGLATTIGTLTSNVVTDRLQTPYRNRRDKAFRNKGGFALSGAPGGLAYITLRQGAPTFSFKAPPEAGRRPKADLPSPSSDPISPRNLHPVAAAPEFPTTLLARPEP